MYDCDIDCYLIMWWDDHLGLSCYTSNMWISLRGNQDRFRVRRCVFNRDRELHSRAHRLCSIYALSHSHASRVCYFFVGILHPKVSWVHYCFTGARTQLLWLRINIHLISMRTTQHSSNVPLVSALPSAFGSIRSSMDQRPIIKTLGG